VVDTHVHIHAFVM